MTNARAGRDGLSDLWLRLHRSGFKRLGVPRFLKECGRDPQSPIPYKRYIPFRGFRKVLNHLMWRWEGHAELAEPAPLCQPKGTLEPVKQTLAALKEALCGLLLEIPISQNRSTGRPPGLLIWNPGPVISSQ